MQTNFSAEQLADPAVAASEKILRTCVHCGFCTATCPTYQVLGDELDSPRGRIYLIKDMLENDRPATEKVVKHLDRCLSCLSCMSTCPSGVNYMHLIDHARAHIDETYKRPWHDKALRGVLAALLPYPRRFRWALLMGWFARPLRFVALGPAFTRVRALLELIPARAPLSVGEDRDGLFPAVGVHKGRVLLLAGCAQRVVQPGINAATVRLLTRLGYEVEIPKEAGCCGALVHHMGKEDASHRAAKQNIAAWLAADDRAPIDGIVINTSGCGTTVKDYGWMLRDNAEWAAPAEKVAGLAKDITEFLDEQNAIPKLEKQNLRVTYHSACSMQHGQQIKTTPQKLLKRAGFEVRDVPEGHLCCGSAGTYNLLQPTLAKELRGRKVANIAKTEPDIIAAGNLGCITQINGGTQTPIAHTVELLDWATGGPKPEALTS